MIYDMISWNAFTELLLKHEYSKERHFTMIEKKLIGFVISFYMLMMLVVLELQWSIWLTVFLFAFIAIFTFFFSIEGTHRRPTFELLKLRRWQGALRIGLVLEFLLATLVYVVSYKLFLFYALIKIVVYVLDYFELDASLN